MFNSKSDHAINKTNQHAIVYMSAAGTPVRLTRADFDSEEDFLKWKRWSDEDYKRSEKEGRSFYDNCILWDDRLDGAGAIPSAEEELFRLQTEATVAEAHAALLEKLKSSLTETQYRRLWLYYIEELSERDIAKKEKVGQQRISRSITAGRKKIENFFKNFPLNRG